MSSARRIALFTCIASACAAGPPRPPTTIFYSARTSGDSMVVLEDPDVGVSEQDPAPGLNGALIDSLTEPAAAAEPVEVADTTWSEELLSSPAAPPAVPVVAAAAEPEAVDEAVAEAEDAEEQEAAPEEEAEPDLLAEAEAAAEPVAAAPAEPVAPAPAAPEPVAVAAPALVVQAPTVEAPRMAEPVAPAASADVAMPAMHGITLGVRNLDTHLTVDAGGGNLLNLDIGATAGVDQLKLAVKNGRIDLHLEMRLDTPAAIAAPVRAPAPAAPVAAPPPPAAPVAVPPAPVAPVAVPAAPAPVETSTPPLLDLVSEATDAGGNARRVLLTSTGTLLERIVPADGTVPTEKILGSVLDLPMVLTIVTDEGRVTRIVEDASGRRIECTLSPTGALTGVRLLPNS